VGNRQAARRQGPHSRDDHPPSNIVEHPELIAERIARFASVVGRENVIAGADCGFASFAATCEVHPSVVWVKLQALAEGARIASRELWRKAG
jgi:5-methyltetrahydropteroyltriglutamate--homocysteine methyltransferase